MGSTVAWSRCFARVVERKLTAKNTVCLSLKPNANFPGFQPGQHINVSVDIQGVRLTRSYSLSNIPAPDGGLEITVRAEEEGVVSNWLNTEAQVGSIIELGTVFGDMTLPSSAPEQLLLLAAGSGITAIMSLLRQAVTMWPSTRVTLLYWDKTHADFCFSEELTALVERYPQLRVHKLTTQDAVVKGVPSGRVSLSQVRALVEDVEGSSAFACGGNGFVDTVNQVLSAEVMSLQTESFSPPVNHLVDQDEKYFELTLARSERVIRVSNQQNLLEQLEAAGVAVESGCRMGICNTCSCQKLSGASLEVDNDKSHTESDSAIRLCVSHAASDLQLAL